MRLLVQPGDGIAALVQGIESATTSVEIVIFRFDRTEVERALASAAKRGVAVQALIAYTNRGGERKLRELELRLLAAGVTVSRTSDDLARYHSKLMIIDRRELYLLAFNFTYLDIERSRSFGVVTEDASLVREAARLFEADTRRKPYMAELSSFVVSPANARQELAKFIEEAQSQLLIYDPKISDPAMLRLLGLRAQAGVEIRIIGRVTRLPEAVESCKLTQFRLHTRTTIRDGEFVFVGSQSLRAAELDQRREAGVIFRDAEIAARLKGIFEEDWRQAGELQEETGASARPAARVAKKVAKALTKGLPPVAPVLAEVVRSVVGDRDVVLDPEEVEATVKDAVKEAVHTAIREVVEDAVEERGEREPASVK